MICTPTVTISYIIAILLILLLCIQELLDSTNKKCNLTYIIVPLLFAFAMNILYNILNILN